jgi:DNA-binding Lrp family transcriptional regulator
MIKTDNEAVILKVLERRAKVIELLNLNWSNARIAKHVGVSATQIHRDIKEMVDEWKQEYLGGIDAIKVREVKRVEHLMGMLWEEVEVSRWRDAKVVDKEGKPTGRTTRVRVQANLDIFKEIRECILSLWKLYGLTQDTTINATQNNLNIGPARDGKPAPQGFAWDMLYTPPDSAQDPVKAQIEAVLQKAGLNKPREEMNSLERLHAARIEEQNTPQDDSTRGDESAE